MKRANVNGPFFVSIGSPAQLELFLELNPTIQRNQLLVDPSADHAAYAALNLRRDFSAGEGVKLKSPDNLDWIAYLSNIVNLSPKPAREGAFPDGVKKQGGTFVLKGDEKVLFVSADRIPGDDPTVNEVLQVVDA